MAVTLEQMDTNDLKAGVIQYCHYRDQCHMLRVKIWNMSDTLMEVEEHQIEALNDLEAADAFGCLRAHLRWFEGELMDSPTTDRRLKQVFASHTVTNSFLPLYCTILHNWLPRGLACTACTGVSSRTGPVMTMMCSAPL